MHRAVLLVIAALVVGGGPEPARAQRGRSASPAARAAKARAKRRTPRRTKNKNLMPKRVGEGFFSRVYRSNDGKWVIKKLRPAIAGVKSLSKKRRAELAIITVEASELLRANGLPVPKSFIPKGKAGVFVQQYSEGIPFDKLQGKAKFEASKNRMKIFGAGNRLAKAFSNGKWYIDTNTANLLFHKDGTVKSWIDPVVPTKPAEITAVQNKLARQKKAAGK